MSLLDRVPGDENIFIGGLFTLKRKEALKHANITHVLSVLRLPLDDRLFDGFQHMVVEVDDVEDENLLVHWPSTNRFIREGLNQGGGVLVHCAMGKSRSAATVIAFLIQKFGITPEQALSHVRKARSICEPNEGFMKQLHLYHEMQAPDHIETSPVYQRWIYQREIELSRACGQAPDADKIRFEDEHVGLGLDQGFDLKCRKCRRTLASSQYLDLHSQRHTSSSSTASLPACAHYFLDPLSWMRPELEQGRLDGRLECPKCCNNVGKYAWQGMQCSCGSWIVPAITLAKSRVDTMAIRADTTEPLAVQVYVMSDGFASLIFPSPDEFDLRDLLIVSMPI